MLLQHGADRRRQPHHGAAKQRMGGGEGGGVGDALGIDRGAEGLGERHQLAMGAALRHRVAGDDQRPLGARQQCRRRGDRRAVAAHPRRHPRRRSQIEIGLGVQHIGRQRQEYRPGRRRQRRLGGAVDGARQVLEAPHLGRPFNERPRDGRQIRPQDGLGEGEALIVLAGGEQDRRLRLLRVVEHAERVAEPGRDMDVGNGELARGLGIAVRHRHHRRFLERQHVAQPGLDRQRVHQRQLGGAGIAEDELDAFLLQEL